MKIRYIYFSFVLTGIMLSFSCTRQIVQAPSADEIVIFPLPPDEPRIQFLTSINTSGDVSGRQSGFNRFLFGEAPEKPIIKPYGIFIRNGKIYIADSGAGGMEIIDLVNNTFEYFIPTGMGHLQLPINCYVDENDKLYVADSKRHQIVIFDEEGKYLDAFGGKENFKPTAVSVYKGNIYLANLEAQKIQVYDTTNFELINEFPDTNPKDSAYLFQPVNIFLANDRVYVSDFGDFKIKIYSLDGEFQKSIGEYGRNYGQFVRPKGISVDRDSNIYVVDAAFENTQVFNNEGELLMFFGGSYNGPGAMGLPAGIAITQELLDYFKPFVHENFELLQLIFVSNQYGPDKVNVYGNIKTR